MLLSKTPVNPEVEKLSLSVIYFNFYQMLGTQNKEALELVRKLEDQEYILQSQKPTNPLPEAEKQKLLSWVEKLEQIEVQESNKNFHWPLIKSRPLDLLSSLNLSIQMNGFAGANEFTKLISVSSSK